VPDPRRLAWLPALAAALALAACGSSAKCPAGQARCDGQCRDLQSDPASCGQCGVRCAAGASCTAGACGCPSPTPLLCGATCVDPATDPGNCGTCGHACGLGTCAGGSCSCTGAATDCGAAQSPQCVDLQSDRNNCGACGTACTRTHEVCLARACTCVAPRPDLCAAAGLCTDLQIDPAHCGSCTTACTRANETCQGGTCACRAPVPDLCAAANLCTNLQTDPSNCGGCGAACTRTGAVCQSGSCACPATRPTVCGNACVNTQTDSSNCGLCGHVCATGRSCQGGSCCPAGQQECPAGGALCCAGGCFDHDAGTGLPSAIFSDCSPLGSKAAAEAAARLWGPGGGPYVGQGLGCDFTTECVAWSRGTLPNECAVWCYAGQPLVAGKVKVEKISAVCLCPDSGSGPWR